MKKILMLLALFALTACAPLDAVPQDPYTMQALAEGQIRATQKAQDEQKVQITQIAAKTQGAARVEMELIDRQAGGTATAWSVMQSQATATYAAATLEAGQATAIAQADSRVATQAALQIEIINNQTAAERDREINRFLSWFVPVAVVFLVAILEMGIVFVVYSLIQRGNREHSLFPTKWGMVIFDQRGPRFVSAPEQSHLRSIPNLAEQEKQVWRATPSGSVLVSKPDEIESSTTADLVYLVLRLLDDSIKVAGQESKTIPRWEKLPGWNKTDCETAKDALERSGAVRIVPNQGTYLTKYECIADLALAVEKNEVRIRPPYPTAGD